jgi:hypothetical protein
MEDAIRHHIQQAGRRPAGETRRLTNRIVSSCWPGGAEDRTEPAALAWIRRWRPTSGGMVLPTCSCATGHCAHLN